MAALRKPHRIAVLVPELTVEGGDPALASAAGLLVWIAVIETCQRHPGLAVFDAEATPLTSRDGHLVPRDAEPGAEPGDPSWPAWAAARRDELIWLELALVKAGAVRLHAVARGGRRERFEATAAARTIGDRIHQVIERWLAARGLPALPRRFEACDAADLVAQARVLAPVLAEQARVHVEAEHRAGSVDAGAAERDTAPGTGGEEITPGGVGARGPGTPAGPGRGAPAARPAQSQAGKLTAALRIPALRLLELACDDDVGALILASDPDHPQALLGRFRASAAHGRDIKLLRRIIASAPGWAVPYGELIGGASLAAGQTPPTELEAVAAAGMAALCRPDLLDAIETAADRLDGHGRTDEGIRLLERAVARDPDAPAPHLALVQLHRRTGRPGAWLVEARAAQRRHGCPDARLPWYPDQIQIDLAASDALLATGRLGEAIALRASRLAGREPSWPRHARILTSWQSDAALAARCYAREGYLRGDPARTIAGCARVPPGDGFEVQALLEALVATGRDDSVVLAWAQHGLGRELAEPVARLAAARCLLAAGHWRRGVEELWRVELTQPGRDEHTEIARCGRLLATAPLAVLEAAIGERVAAGAVTLARRMARDVADFVPGAHTSLLVLRALGKLTPLELDPAWFAGLPADTAARRAIDAVFAEAAAVRAGGDPDGTAAGGSGRGIDPLELQARADRLVNRWLAAVFGAVDGDAQGDTGSAVIAEAAAYAAAHALVRYLVATTGPPTPLAGGYRTVAGEALALVRRHAGALGDRTAHGVLGALDPVLRRVDRWLGSAWLGTVERSCAIDERAGGDTEGFVAPHAIVAARILGPEETALLAASVARLVRDRPDGWAAAVVAQASRLAAHTGVAGVAELAAAVAWQLAAGELERDDAIDLLYTACYLGEGVTAEPCVHAARVLFAAGRGPAAFAMLCAGLAAADPAWRTAQLVQLAEPWRQAVLDVPLDLDLVLAELVAALAHGEPTRAEKLGRFAIALDPRNPELHRNLGVALARQGKLPDALHHLVRGAPGHATELLAGVLAAAGRLADALAVLDHAQRSHARAEHWLTHAGIARAARDSRRAADAYAQAYRLEPAALGPAQLSAYAGVLDELGDHATCEAIATQLLRTAGDDLTWKTWAWAHLACAHAGQGKRGEAKSFAQWAVDHNPVADHAAGFAAILARVTADAPVAAPPAAPPSPAREPVFAQLDAGELTAARAWLGDPSWRVRRAALIAARWRASWENDVEVAPRARAASLAILADTVGAVDREAAAARVVALAIREQAQFAREPAARLGDQLSRAEFERGAAPGEPTAPAVHADRVVVPGSQISRVSDYVALLDSLAALPPSEALARFSLDEPAYLAVAAAWAAAITGDPGLAAAIAAGLARPSASE